MASRERPGPSIGIPPHPKIAISCPLPPGISLEEVKEWITGLGGSYHEKVSATTDVLCASLHRVRYLHAEALRAQQQETFVVSIDWLKKSWKSGGFIPPIDFAINEECCYETSPLDGCIIAFTHTYPRPEGDNTYDAVRNAIVRLGGVHDIGLNWDRLTHFCTTQDELLGQNFLPQQIRNHVPEPFQKPIKIVDHKWLVQCLKKKKRVEEEKWALDIHGDAESSQDDTESEG